MVNSTSFSQPSKILVLYHYYKQQKDIHAQNISKMY